MWEQLLILVHWVVKWRMLLLLVAPFLQHYLPFLDENVTHIYIQVNEKHYLPFLDENVMHIYYIYIYICEGAWEKGPIGHNNHLEIWALKVALIFTRQSRLRTCVRSTAYVRVRV